LAGDGSFFVDGSSSFSACGSPLAYLWGCAGSIEDTCHTFREAAYDQAINTLSPVASGEIYDITLKVCDREGLELCSTISGYQYEFF
jgi:hypothetical protein